MLSFDPIGDTAISDTASPSATQAPEETMFSPSQSRTILVQAAPGAFVPSAGGFWDMTNPKQPRGLKDPDGTFDVTFDWTPWLADIADSAASFEFIVGGGLTKQNDFRDGNKATVFVSAGTPAGRAPVTCRIRSASSPARIEDRTIYLTIEDR